MEVPTRKRKHEADDSTRPRKRIAIIYEQNTQTRIQQYQAAVSSISASSLEIPTELWYHIAEFCHICPFFFLRRTCKTLRCLPIPRRMLERLHITTLDVDGVPHRDAAYGPIVNRGLVRYRNGLVIPQYVVYKNWMVMNDYRWRCTDIEGWLSPMAIRSIRAPE
jgi:hypothetical protein